MSYFFHFLSDGWRPMLRLRRAVGFGLLTAVLLGCGGGEPVADSLPQPTAVPPTIPATEAAVAEPTAVPAEPTAVPDAAAPVIITGSGDITAVVDQYRQALGGANNGGDPGSRADGFREVNWDSVPDENAAPASYVPNFFNGAAAPFARGLVLSSTGVMMISADSDNPTGTLPRFGNVNPTYVDTFVAFSEERLFSPVGSNIVDVTFFVPGQEIPATTRGFGAVYTDIDTDHTAFEYFDANGQSLGQFGVPIADHGLSFLGVVYPEPIIARVRVTYGTDSLGPDDGGGVDVAVMDNFIFGEPQAIPGATAVAGAVAEPTAEPVQTFHLQFQTVEDKRLAGVALDLAELEPAPEGKSYAVWLFDDAGQPTLLGEAAGGELFQFVDPDGRNLVGQFASAAVSLEASANVAGGSLAAPTDVVLSGRVPAAIVPQVRQLAVLANDTPAYNGYDPGLTDQAALAATHGQLALDALAAGDHPYARSHAEHVNNILVGGASPDYGDLNGDGVAQNPGDGYGVRPYADKVAELAGAIAATPNLPTELQTAAQGMVICATNISEIFGPGAQAKAREVLASADGAAAEAPAQEMAKQTGGAAEGVDVNGNGQVDIAAEECGARQIYALSHELFDIWLTAQN